MPLHFKVTREDMLRSKVLDPGWYKIKVVKMWEEKASDGESMNTWIEGKVISGPAQKDGSNIVDTPTRRCFSEKAPGMATPFLRAIGCNVTENGFSGDIEKGIGQEILAYNENRMYEGRMMNDWKDFKRVA